MVLALMILSDESKKDKSLKFNKVAIRLLSDEGIKQKIFRFLHFLKNLKTCKIISDHSKLVYLNKLKTLNY